MNTRPLLILDLDETLIHANVDLVHDKYSYKLPFHYVYNRPHLNDFLLQANKHYSLAVWSSATDDYVNDIIKNSFPEEIKLVFAWDRSHCTQRFDENFGSLIYVKNLRKVKQMGFPLERVLIIDDSPEKLKLNYGNVILIKPFEGNLNDSELPKLSRYLDSIADNSNYLQLDKRNWIHKLEK
jgi:RNA polymerase II subunit A small phosphatase-like protein